MNFLNFDLKKVIMIAIVVLLPLISLNTQQLPNNKSWYDKPFSLLASFASDSFFSMSSGVKNTTLLYLDLINIKKKSQSLQEENQELKARLQELDEIRTENNRLNVLLDFKQSTKMELLAAKVMGRDLFSDHATVMINKGTHHGLKSGQAVISVNGVVGYVFRPEALTSQVLLITDRYAVVDGIVARSRARGIVEGKTASSCSLLYVEKTEDVQVGDIIVTSGLDNIFPKGFPVATVEAVENKMYAVSLKVDLRPIVDPDKLEEVFVIINAAEQDLTDKMAAR